MKNILLNGNSLNFFIKILSKFNLNIYNIYLKSSDEIFCNNIKLIIPNIININISINNINEDFDIIISNEILLNITNEKSYYFLCFEQNKYI